VVDVEKSEAGGVADLETGPEGTVSPGAPVGDRRRREEGGGGSQEPKGQRKRARVAAAEEVEEGPESVERANLEAEAQKEQEEEARSVDTRKAKFFLEPSIEQRGGDRLELEQHSTGGAIEVSEATAAADSATRVLPSRKARIAANEALLQQSVVQIREEFSPTPDYAETGYRWSRDRDDPSPEVAASQLLSLASMAGSADPAPTLSSPASALLRAPAPAARDPHVGWTAPMPRGGFRHPTRPGQLQTPTYSPAFANMPHVPYASAPGPPMQAPGGMSLHPSQYSSPYATVGYPSYRGPSQCYPPLQQPYMVFVRPRYFGGTLPPGGQGRALQMEEFHSPTQPPGFTGSFGQPRPPPPPPPLMSSADGGIQMVEPAACLLPRGATYGRGKPEAGGREDVTGSTEQVRRKMFNLHSASRASTQAPLLRIPPHASSPGDEPAEEARKGRWSAEEKEFASKMVYYFQRGMLNLREGTTLRAYLAFKLRCNPMRVSKKFGGLGSTVYRPRECPGVTLEQVQSAEDHLIELERRLRRAEELVSYGPSAGGSDI